MSYEGGATLAWQSDFTQFYLQDDSDVVFEAPIDITQEMMTRRWHRAPIGLVVYTNDCLQQLIDIRIFSAERAADPTEWRSGNPWTQTELATAEFPSRRFTITSPSHIGGPFFRVGAVAMAVRLQWMEFQGSRDDSVPVQPDVIRLDLWPA